jgi:hypothetical protein
METAVLETEDLILNVEVGLHEHCMHDRDGYHSGVRPNHWIPGRTYTFIGQIDFLDRGHLQPGQTCEATMQCIIARQDRDLFVPGFAWHICEANMIVGYARVLSVP